MQKCFSQGLNAPRAQVRSHGGITDARNDERSQWLSKREAAQEAKDDGLTRRKIGRAPESRFRLMGAVERKVVSRVCDLMISNASANGMCHKWGSRLCVRALHRYLISEYLMYIGTYM